MEIKNGSTTTSHGMVETVKAKLGDYVVTSDFYILPLRGLPHIVLWVQWLYILEEVVCNYKMLEMKFKIHGKEVVLCGMKYYGEANLEFHKMEATKKKS